MRSLYILVIFTIISTKVVVGDTLYGLSEQVQLISIDPTSFKVTTIGKPISHEAQAQNLASIDKTNGIYYFIGANIAKNASQLIGLSVKTGEIISTYDLPFVLEGIVGVGEYVTVDPKTGQVIAIGFTKLNEPYQILRIDPKSKTHKVIASFATSSVILGPFAAYDGTNDIVFLENVPVGEKDIYIQGYDAYSGKLVHSLKNPLIAEALDWDPKTGLMFGIGLQSGKNNTLERTFLSLDGKTGTFKLVATLEGYSIISSSISTLDPVERNLVVLLSKSTNFDIFYLVNVNIDTGKVTNAPEACKSDPVCPWSLEFA